MPDRSYATWRAKRSVKQRYERIVDMAIQAHRERIERGYALPSESARALAHDILDAWTTLRNATGIDLSITPEVSAEMRRRALVGVARKRERTSERNET